MKFRALLVCAAIAVARSESGLPRIYASIHRCSFGAELKDWCGYSMSQSVGGLSWKLTDASTITQNRTLAHRDWCAAVLDNRTGGSKSRLSSPIYRTPSDNPGGGCYSFTYYLRGVNIERLNIIIEIFHGSTYRMEMFTRRGDQGDRWLTSGLALRLPPNTTMTVMVSIDVTTKKLSSQENEFTAAVDDLLFKTYGHCPDEITQYSTKGQYKIHPQVTDTNKGQQRTGYGMRDNNPNHQNHNKSQKYTGQSQQNTAPPSIQDHSQQDADQSQRNTAPPSTQDRSQGQQDTGQSRRNTTPPSTQDHSQSQQGTAESQQDSIQGQQDSSQSQQVTKQGQLDGTQGQLYSNQSVQDSVKQLQDIHQGQQKKDHSQGKIIQNQHNIKFVNKDDNSYNDYSKSSQHENMENQHRTVDDGGERKQGQKSKTDIVAVVQQRQPRLGIRVDHGPKDLLSIHATLG